MAAPPPAPPPGAGAALAPLAAHLGGLATQAQVNALTVQVNALAVQVNALAVQVAALPAQIAALLAPLGIPAIAAGASVIVQAIASARGRNAHDRDDVYAVVPLADGTLPVHWPVGFARPRLIAAPIGVINALLADYGLPNAPVPPPAGGGAALNRRNALAVHIGTTRV